MGHIWAHGFWGPCGLLIAQEFCFQNVFWNPGFFFEYLILPAERRIFFKKQKIGKCGPLIDPTKAKMRPTYWPYNTYIYIYICIYMYAVVFNFGVLFVYLRVQKCSRFLPHHSTSLKPKKRVFPRWNLFIRRKVSLEIPTCSLSSNAFKNGALMLRNIGTPLSNASRHPIFERINFPCFRPCLLFSSQPRNPYFCSVFHVKEPFRQDPPNACSCIISSQKNINKKSKRK